VIVFRNTDVDLPFFWDGDRQPAARWHRDGEGPAQYTCSTPSASWAEFLRHAGITDPADLAGIARTMWAIEVPDVEPTGQPTLPIDTLTGDLSSYRLCQVEAARLRSNGASRLVAPSAATLPGTPSGWQFDGDLVAAPARPESTIVLYGERPAVVAWVAAILGRPETAVLDRVRHF
jgi:hypothetical protein